MAEVAVADAHALIWAATGQTRRLGREARRHFAAVASGDRAVYIPTIALAEIGEAAHRGAVRFRGQSFERWLVGLAQSPHYIAVDLTVEVLVAAQSLFAIPERGDRLIAATAQIYQCPLITCDPAIAAAAAVPLLW